MSEYQAGTLRRLIEAYAAAKAAHDVEEATSPSGCVRPTTQAALTLARECLETVLALCTVAP